jgi:hypothetical protein
MDDDVIKWLTKIFNRYRYDAGIIPEQWLKSEFIALPQNATDIEQQAL